MIEQLLQAMFADNLALAFFLGMCTFLAVSNRVETAIGLGIAITVVLLVTVPLNHVIFHFLLAKGAWSWLDHIGFESINAGDLDLRFLTLVSFIGIIAASVQILEIALDRFSPTLYHALGIFLPLITVNCAILGASLFMLERKLSFSGSVIYALGSGLGWALAVILFAAIRERLRYSLVPKGLQGLGIAFIVTGLISMGFSAFSRLPTP